MTDTGTSPVAITVMALINEVQPATQTITFTRDSTWENLKLDSLDIVELAILLEDKFNIPFDEDHFPATFGELVRDIEARTA